MEQERQGIEGTADEAVPGRKRRRGGPNGPNGHDGVRVEDGATQHKEGNSSRARRPRRTRNEEPEATAQALLAIAGNGQLTQAVAVPASDATATQAVTASAGDGDATQTLTATAGNGETTVDAALADFIEEANRNKRTTDAVAPDVVFELTRTVAELSRAVAELSARDAAHTNGELVKAVETLNTRVGEIAKLAAHDDKEFLKTLSAAHIATDKVERAMALIREHLETAARHSTAINQLAGVALTQSAETRQDLLRTQRLHSIMNAVFILVVLALGVVTISRRSNEPSSAITISAETLKATREPFYIPPPTASTSVSLQPAINNLPAATPPSAPNPAARAPASPTEAAPLAPAPAAPPTPAPALVPAPTNLSMPSHAPVAPAPDLPVAAAAPTLSSTAEAEAHPGIDTEVKRVLKKFASRGDLTPYAIVQVGENTYQIASAGVDPSKVPLAGFTVRIDPTKGKLYEKIYRQRRGIQWMERTPPTAAGDWYLETYITQREEERTRRILDPQIRKVRSNMARDGFTINRQSGESVSFQSDGTVEYKITGTKLITRGTIDGSPASYFEERRVVKITKEKNKPARIVYTD